MNTKKAPSGITTEIVGDYPGKFFLDETELKRLVRDVEFLLTNGEQKPSFRYWVGLQNGILYETDDLEVVLAAELARIIFLECNSGRNSRHYC